MLRIGYFGDGPWAHNAFKKLVSDPDIHVAFAMPRYDLRDSVLINMAKEAGVPVEVTPNVNNEEFLESIRHYDVELFVSMSFNQIFRRNTINYPDKGIINCHAGKLPFYRGRNILNWALINDEKEFGITVHYVDEGIDTGDIILQRTYGITDDDNYETLLNRAYVECADILYDAIKMIDKGNVQRIQQETIDKLGLYCGMRGLGDEIIEWNSTSREIFNFVRAICKPGPSATSYINGKEIKIDRVRYYSNAPKYIGIPGQVLAKTEKGFIVKTSDTIVEVVDYDFYGRIKVGDRLKNE